MARLSQEWRTTHKKYKFIKVDKNGNTSSVRHRNRCLSCGRARGFLRKFELCRLCFRGLALKGEVPGVIKASW